MGIPLVSGAMLQCSFGAAPSQFTVTSQGSVFFKGAPTATVGDCMPMANIKPFGMCSSLANPQVAAATAAALGVLTPMPCVPVTAAWNPAGSVLAGAQPIIDNSCRCACAYGGLITVAAPGQSGVVI